MPPRYMMASAVTVGGVHDPEEHQAEKAASAIASGGTAHAVLDQGARHDYPKLDTLRRSCGADCACEECRKGVRDTATIRRLEASTPEAAPADVAASVRAAESLPGRPMQSPMRARLERGLGADLGHVRVHDGPEARQSAASLGARAYARGADIYLGAGESEHDTRLMAHEATHVVQQDRVAAPVQPLRRQEKNDGILPSISSLFWGAVNKLLSPDMAALLREIADKGLFTTLKGRISATLGGVFGGIPNPVAQVRSVVAIFSGLASSAHEILAALAAGDCKPFLAALNRLKDSVSQMAGEAWDKIVAFLTPIGDYLSDLWKRFGAPVVDWLTKVAGSLWDKIKAIGAKIWSVVDYVKTGLLDVWGTVKHFLGIGDSPDDQHGLIQWIQDKAEAAWGEIKGVLAPVIEPIKAVAADVIAFIPLDKIIHLRDTITTWLDSVAAMADSMGEDQVAENQDSLRKTILPAVLKRVASLRDGILSAGSWVAGKIGALATKVTGFIGSLSANVLLSPFAGLLGVVQDGISQFSGWAQGLATGLFATIGNALVRLSKFIEPVMNLLERVAGVLGDLMGKLPDLILGPVWKIIPACIRDPIKDFVLQQILKRVPLFQQLQKIGDIWEKVQQVALRILRQIFVDGDLKGAAWTFFRSLLDILGIPPKLVTGIVSKAAKAIGDILKDPVGFLLNLLRALKQGFGQFFDNIGRHLLSGVADWMFAQAAEAGINVPTEFTFRAIGGFILEVLGITVQRVFERIEKKLGKPAADRLRALYEKATRIASAIASGVETAFEWIGILQREGPAGILNHLKEKLADIKDKLIDGAIDWLMDNLIGAAVKKLLKMLDPTGIMAVVESLDAVMSAIQTLGARARQILEAVDNMLNGVIEIAHGVLGRAAGFVEDTLARGVPVVIDFLANWMGLEGIGQRIHEIIEKLQGKVGDAMDWLIEKGKGVFDKLTGNKDKEGTEPNAEAKTFTLLGEGHTMRVQDAGGDWKIQMASGVFGPMRAKLTSIRERYADPVKGYLVSVGKGTEAENLRKHIDAAFKEIDGIEAESKGKRPPPNWWEPILTDLELFASAMHDAFGPGGALKQGDVIVERGSKLGMIVDTTGDLRDTSIGFTAKREGRTQFFSFDSVNKMWEMPGPRPPSVGYSGAVGGGWRTFTGLQNPLSAGGDPKCPGTPGLGSPGPVSGRIRTDQGHLVANILGGPGTCDNIVAMHNGANQGQMKRWENFTRGVLNQTPAPVLNYMARPIWSSGSPSTHAPTQIEVHVLQTYPLAPGAVPVPLTNPSLPTPVDNT